MIKQNFDVDNTPHNGRPFEIDKERLEALLKEKGH